MMKLVKLDGDGQAEDMEVCEDSNHGGDGHRMLLAKTPTTAENNLFVICILTAYKTLRLTCS